MIVDVKPVVPVEFKLKRLLAKPIASLVMKGRSGLIFSLIPSPMITLLDGSKYCTCNCWLTIKCWARFGSKAPLPVRKIF